MEKKFTKLFLLRGAGGMPATMLSAAASLVALCAIAAPAHAQIGRVVNAAAGLCLTVNGFSKLVTDVCNADAANQQFTRTALYELRIGSLCADGGGVRVYEVMMAPCAGTPRQRWVPQAGLLITQGATAQYCMAVDGANLAAGTRIITYECVNHPSQKWSNPTPATNINGKVIYLVSSLGGKCLDVEGESKSDNTRLIGYDCKAGLNTQFVFMGNGQLRDYAGRNKCLDLKLDLFGKLTDQVVILPCADAANSTTQLINKVTQRWYLKADGTIRNGNGWCMELAGVWFGSQWVKIATCTASGPQMWKPGILYSANAYFGTIPKLSILSAGAIGNINTTNGKSLVASGVCTTAVCGNIVAAGGGNIVATDGATIVAAGGGNIVAAGGGNIIAAGGGNIIAAGGGNVVAGGAGN